MTVDPLSGRPLYLQIADDLRERVYTQQLPRGARLPSEAELAATYNTTRPTVRQALRTLSEEGLIESRRGVGVFVRSQRQPLRRMTMDRFARRHREQGKGALAAEAEAQGRSWRQEVLELAEVSPPPAVADRLNLDEDARAFVRRRRVWIEDVPMQLADSYFPIEIAAGTRIVEEDTGPGGVYARLEERGHRLTRFHEELSFRMPTPSEVRALALDSGVPVVDLLRVAYAGEQPVELFMSVMAGDRHIFVYDIPAD